MLRKILIGLLLLASQACWAADTYNPSTNQLSIPSVYVGSDLYKNVTLKIGNVISISPGMPMTTSDIFNESTQTLFIPSVISNGIIYNNVTVTVAEVFSVEKVINLYIYKSSRAPGNAKLFWDLRFIDLNDDGIDDVLAFDDKNFKLIPFVSDRLTGGWDYTEKLFPEGMPYLCGEPKLISVDVNADGFKDLLMYCLGELKLDRFKGIEPILYIKQKNGTYLKDYRIRDAYFSLIGKDSNQLDTSVSAKDVTFTDLNGDGFPDFWVESSGGWNIVGHTLLSNGSKYSVNYNYDMYDYWGPNLTGWRYSVSRFEKIRKDSKSDLILGQMRAHEWQKDEYSQIFINKYPTIFKSPNVNKLPRPKFNDGWTKVLDVAVGDVNQDGLSDIVFAHTRFGSASQIYKDTSWKGFYFQLLIQDVNGNFTDESQSFGSQEAWSNAANKYFEFPFKMYFSDVNGDGLPDLLVSYNWWVVGNPFSRPLAFINYNSGQFMSASNISYKNNTYLRYLGGNIGWKWIHVDQRTNDVIFESYIN